MGNYPRLPRPVLRDLAQRHPGTYTGSFGMDTTQYCAEKRFPRSRGRIRGSGWFALVSKCQIPWHVNLYRTVEERNDAWRRWANSKCMANTCAQQHECVTVNP